MCFEGHCKITFTTDFAKHDDCWSWFELICVIKFDSYQKPMYRVYTFYTSEPYFYFILVSVKRTGQQKKLCSFCFNTQAKEVRKKQGIS